MTSPKLVVDRAAPRHGHPRPRMVRVECGEIGDRLDSDPGALAADAEPIPQTSQPMAIRSIRWNCLSVVRLESSRSRQMGGSVSRSHTCTR